MTPFSDAGCGPFVDQLRQDFWAAGACKCDTRKALDFPTLRFGTRGAEVQILSPGPFFSGVSIFSWRFTYAVSARSCERSKVRFPSNGLNADFMFTPTGLRA
jgi:hypothetical protein